MIEIGVDSVGDVESPREHHVGLLDGVVIGRIAIEAACLHTESKSDVVVEHKLILSLKKTAETESMFAVNGSVLEAVDAAAQIKLEIGNMVDGLS
jgi:hypothetical protein